MTRFRFRPPRGFLDLRGCPPPEEIDGGRFSEAGGFRKLAEQPEALASDGRLFGLFQPERSTRRVYRALTGGMGGHSRTDKVVRFVGSTVWQFKHYAAIGAVPSAAALVAVGSADAERHVPIVTASALQGLGGALLGAFVGLGVSFVRRVPPNGFGLCSGNGIVVGLGRKILGGQALGVDYSKRQPSA